MTNLFALIVGIEKYDLPNSNVSGPVDGALQMATWCSRLGAPTKNICMFLSIDETDPTRASQYKDKLSQFEDMGITINKDTSLSAIDTYWRNALPTRAIANSKLLVYWCGHGVTRGDRDRVLLHTDYNPTNLPTRVTSLNNLAATLSTHAYGRFHEQLIVADVCGDFANYAIQPGVPQPTKPVDSIKQHCYFASLDGESAQIQNGIGQFTEATLDVLSQYQAWPDLDDLKTRMDSKFKDGTKRPFKISIRSPGAIDDMPSNPDQLDNARTDPDSQAFEILKKTCDAHIARNELEEILRSIDKFLNAAKVGAFDPAKKSLQLLQSDVHVFREGERNATLGSDAGAERRRLIVRVQQLLDSIESIVSKKRQDTQGPSNESKTSHEFFREHVHNLLKGSNELTRVFFEELFPEKKKFDADCVVDHLVAPTIPTDDDYPLLRLRNLLQDLEETNKFIDSSCRSSLTAIIELLSVASFPPQDRECVEVAMKEVLRSNPQSGFDFSLNTTNSKDAEKLLVATRLKLTSRNINGLDFNQLLNNSYREGDPSPPMLNIIHVVPEPMNVPDNESTEDFYARSIMIDLNLEQPETAWKESLNHELSARKGRKGDGKVVAMMISQDKKTAIQVLRNSFPLLLVVVLPPKSVVRYSTVFNDRAYIETLLQKILRNSAK